MSTFRNPVGPQPSGVYWRRRLIFGLGLLAVIVAIALIVFLPKGGEPAAVNTSTPNPSNSASSTPTDSDEPAAACAQGVLSVVAITDKTSYGEGELPQLSLTVTNNGDAACELSVGSDVQVYAVTSGEEAIWTSTDCQTGAVAATQLIEAGADVSTPAIEWDRTRSSTETCDDENRDPVIAGGATYRLATTIAGVTSAETRPFILE